jgi:hypothetical protein
MQELFSKILEHIPMFLSNLVELLTGPKRFLLSHAEETPTDGLVFLGIAAVLFQILATPIIGVDRLVEGTILLVVAGVVVFAVSAFALILSWRLVGGGATPKEHMVLLAYSSAPIVLLMPVVFLLLKPDLGNVGPEDLPRVIGQWAEISMVILNIAAGLWTIVIWGAFRTINQVSRARSVVAFAIASLFGILTTQLGTRFGFSLTST